MFDAPSLDVFDIARILSDDLVLHPTESITPEIQVIGSGVVQVEGCIDFPEQTATIIVRDHEDGTTSFTVRAIAPVEWEFSTTLIGYMCTEEMIEGFKEHIAETVEAVVREGFREKGLCL